MTLSLGSRLAAQAPDQKAPTAKQMKVNDTPVECCSKRLQKSLGSPQAMAFITAEQIRTSGACQLADLLRLESSQKEIPAQGLSIPAPTIEAARGVQTTSNAGLLNDCAPQYALREAGMQAAFRF